MRRGRRLAGRVIAAVASEADRPALHAVRGVLGRWGAAADRGLSRGTSRTSLRRIVRTRCASLVLLEVHYRRRVGETCLAENYRDRFPDMTFDLPTADASGQTEPGPTEPSTNGATRYRSLRQHARGGLGVVYAAHDSELNRRVALKEIRDECAHDGASRQRFELEAVITGGLEHPGIVPIYGFGRHADGRPFYAMRFIEGVSLKEAVDICQAADRSRGDPAERASSLRHLLRRFLDVCHAIDYAHSKGVLHRDLKPSNVMLGPFGETLVVDWGLAKILESAEAGTTDRVREAVSTAASGAAGTPTLTANAVGTPAYMSPEQAAGRHDLVGPASDVYSLGGMLYYVLTGKNPVERSETPGSSEAIPGLRRAVPQPTPGECAPCLRLSRRFVSRR